MIENGKLGFGLMRLPKNDGEIDFEKTCRLVDKFIDGGFAYFDTAYCYPGSEEMFKRAVADRYPHEKYVVATKMAGWLLSDELTPAKMFEHQLERCGVEYFDYYLLHALQPSNVDTYYKYDCWNFCMNKKAEGKIKKLGFSFHGKPDMLEELLQKHPQVDFVQLQINYIDWEDKHIVCANEIYDIARKYNKDIIVMEPVRGGLLANLPCDAAKKIEALGSDKSMASYALRFVGSLDGVKIVLSGMGTDEQMDDNINTFTDFEPLNTEEIKAINEVKGVMLAKGTIPCTACEYCVEGCVKKIDIPSIFGVVNMKRIYDDTVDSKSRYDNIIKDGSGKASECLHCGKCEKVCPQHIKIISELEEAAKIFEK